MRQADGQWAFRAVYSSRASVRKGPFSALAVSIFGLPCAAYLCTPPRKLSISLPERKIPPFRTETSPGMDFTKMKIGFIGYGQAGAPLADHLQRLGHTVTLAANDTALKAVADEIRD